MSKRLGETSFLPTAAGISCTGRRNAGIVRRRAPTVPCLVLSRQAHTWAEARRDAMTHDPPTRLIILPSRIRARALLFHLAAAVKQLLICQISCVEDGAVTGAYESIRLCCDALVGWHGKLWATHGGMRLQGQSPVLRIVLHKQFYLI